jgi:uncharacterized protein (DUF58 family)
VALVVLGTAAAFLSGRPEAAALVAPFALALGAGVASAEPLRLTAVVAVDRLTVTEGDELEVVATFSSSADVPALEVFLSPGPALGSAGGPSGRPAGLALRAGEPSSVEMRARALHWGHHEIGQVLFRCRSLFGLLEVEGHLACPGTVTVYPSPLALRGLVRSHRAHLAAGAQVASGKGSGAELAGVRAYVAGDRARDINWRASARHGGLFTNERHPERGTDVVLFLDSFDCEALDRAVPAACALADAYLAQRDRLALVTFGGVVKWLRPGMGTRQLYVVVDALLSAEVFQSAAWRDLEVLPSRLLPPGALVLALSSLEDERSLAAFVDMRRRGIDLVLVDVVPRVQLPDAPGDLAGAAYRLWRVQRERLHEGYRAMGVPTVEWLDGQPLAEVMEEVGAWSRRPAYGGPGSPGPGSSGPGSSGPGSSGPGSSGPGSSGPGSSGYGHGAT